MKPTSKHGGKRQGSGPKKKLPFGVMPWTIRVTEHEKGQIKQLIEDMRKEPES